MSGIVADFDSLAEVRGMAQKVMSRHARLDVLLNNAGTIRRRRELTRDGFERQFGINHLAPFLLTTLLIERLAASAPARVVTVASRAHRRVPGIDFDDLSFGTRRYDARMAYGISKLANILFSNELARRLEGRGVTSNALHPGVVATNIFGNFGSAGRVFGLVLRPLMLSAEQGAATSVYLATSPEVAARTGRYFVDCVETAPSAAAADPIAAQRLWEISERLVGAAG